MPGNILTNFVGSSGTINEPVASVDEAWKALSALGRGKSRVDYLLTLDQIAPAKIAVIGYSCDGTALSRRIDGETIERITTSFPDGLNNP
jgi:hypothetical protein